MGDETQGFGRNLWLVDEMEERYRTDPSSVGEDWRRYFEGETPLGEPARGAGPDRDDGDPGDRTDRPEPADGRPAATDGDDAPAKHDARGSEPSTEDAGPDLGEDDELTTLIGTPAVIAERMEESRELPTATSVRAIPAKLLEVNRRILNNQIKRLHKPGKVSFTHILGWAVVRALQEFPVMNAAYASVDGDPHMVRYGHVNLGIAIDMERKDGSRTLLVPNIKHADTMDFAGFWETYEDVVQRVRSGSITPDDFAGTTATLTNPGTVGTVQSVPRLMPGQGVIVGVGAIGYPPEYQAADPETLSRVGIGRTITMTSTYDHRIIQGASSGQFLRHIHELLLGEHDFYDEIFRSMSIPYVPARWASDANPAPGTREAAEKQARVFQLINMYRVRGHLIADLDPLRLKPPTIHDELDPLTYGLTIWDLDREFATNGLAGQSTMTLGRILGTLRDAYCRTIGIEYMHIQVTEEKAWIQAQVEGVSDELDGEEKRRLLAKLNEAEAFERFIHTKYLGHKRFSLEGSESMIPFIDEVLNEAADAGMEDVSIGMAHRGRLNVLANTIGKSYAQVFREFEGELDPSSTHGSGDVKYHLGARGVHKSPDGAQVDIEVAANPSHLEAVDPVLEGMVRAKQDRAGEGAVDRILPFLVHGDAAFSGQGVVAETLNLSQLWGYHTGGTIHLVVNNQVGFTTDAADARSSFYATDIAKAVQAPIFHVNGDDPEAVIRVARLAFWYRQQFHKDVVVDLMCYRRLGHNEGDDPSLTQPAMYRVIDEHPSVRDLYLDRLVARDDLTRDEADEIARSFRALLDQAFEETRGLSRAIPDAPPEELPAESAPTAVDADRVQTIEEALATIPEGFNVHPKLTKVLENRHELFLDGQVDWALAEAIAFASLAEEGHGVRLAGEDSRRGTFSHRHAVLVDYQTEEEYAPLESFEDNPAQVQLVDSMLSEFAAMGFEYGYSVVATDTLVLWEAQFGDFVNGGQVVIDQFIAAGEDKWNQRSGLVLLLPHGFEGQGPEHSSARIERFLILSAEDNWRVVNPSTPAQYFHALRRQIHDPALKPLVVFTPKSLLRTRATFSDVADLSRGTFFPVLDDPDPPAEARRVLVCSGKVYYDLAAHREEQGIDDVAILRLEELFPFPADELERRLTAFGDAELMWVQEEPSNMGPWRHVYFWLTSRLGRVPRLAGRDASASPATGSHKVHDREQEAIVEAAFAAD
ncbi:MAG: multifunctional oxoglutarate decarboxylase/oxoglutarate dehydrogenase thiamine pyrophosphate-binding subunit/dihydrolipoyllysine-residue succinyltransferase subunit [Acidimicrobiia bacterium]|nr:multifunctional oxoglutarate decarboxylase/oxoglutarate dehydrogenase thiamine pyrophosphate-binding subunit/dihydrolipoyllysine-residue succinyltransferase subunit [Acidimicrobiia bacterium]